MGSRRIVLVSTAGFSVLNTGIFWREAKTKRLFSQCIIIRQARYLPTDLLYDDVRTGISPLTRFYIFNIYVMELPCNNIHMLS